MLAGPRAAAEAEKVRTRLLHEVDERRNPRTKATVMQLLDRYPEVEYVLLGCSRPQAGRA